MRGFGLKLLAGRGRRARDSGEPVDPPPRARDSGEPVDPPPAVRAPELPPPVTTGMDASVVELFQARVRQVQADTYAGIPMLKFPEDLRVYEHLLFSQRVEVVLEVGVHAGGSALWFRDRLRTLSSYGWIANPSVIGVDLGVAEAQRWLAAVDPSFSDEITLIEGDFRDPDVADHVRSLIRPGASCLVIEDTVHTYETTISALREFARVVQPGGFFVVEDGCVDIEELRASPDWPRGVLPAIHEWLETAEGRDFRQRRDLELYGITSHPEGFLQRVRAAGD